MKKVNVSKRVDSIQMGGATDTRIGLFVWAFIIAFPIVILLGVTFGFWEWWLSKLATGFTMAFIAWLVKKARNKPTGNFFIGWWGLGLTAILAAYDILRILFERIGWVM